MKVYMPGRALAVIALLLLMMACAASKPGLRAYRQGDYAAAIKESTPHAENGDAYSQWLLGSSYANAEPPIKDIREAERWIKKAADQDFVPAMVDLAKISLFYDSVKNEQVAYGWYQKAANYGNSEAQFMLGLYSFSGTGGSAKDDVKAFTWLLLSAKQGHPLAKLMLEKSKDKISQMDLGKAQQMASEWRPINTKKEE
ncbi:MAG TPA: sel1 repeat family protein [Desulfuromonadales bacterium]|nr:sel1 repeat family protein [Desulfuromonadales bacterium]